MDTLGSYDSLHDDARLRIMTQKGTSRNSCLVPYTLQPFEALTPEGKPLKGLGHRDEPFRMERRVNQPSALSESLSRFVF